MRTLEESAEAIVVKMPGETRAERRAEETEHGVIADPLRDNGRGGLRNQPGATIAVTTRQGARGTDGWSPARSERAGAKSSRGRGKDNDERE